MGQIANQMLVEWCCKIAQRTKWKKGIPEKKHIPWKKITPEKRERAKNYWKIF